MLLQLSPWVLAVEKAIMEDQVAKGAVVGILTLGRNVPTPIKSTLTLHAFIFDSEKNEIAFYKKLLPVE